MKLIEKDYNFKCEYLDIDYRKRQNKRLFTSSLILLGALGIMAMSEPVWAIILTIFAIIFYKYDYYALNKKYHLKVISKQLEFTNFFSYLIVFLQRKINLYQALQECQEYLQGDLESLVEEFKDALNQTTSIEPYLLFAEKFKSESINEIMIILYQYEQNGASEVDLRNFSVSLEKLRNNEVDEYIRVSTLKFDYYGFLPLITSAIIATSFAIAILNNFGGLLNV